ncbi:MAG TPA: transglycosylase domain-containing protein [Verrucomicrobiae bacterium]|nr:transglycosylase domain-containing protein [Verrucomicrobiae bacterium]
MAARSSERTGGILGWLFAHPILALLLAVILAPVAYYGLWALAFDMRKVSHMPATSVILDRNGVVLQRFYEEHRLLVGSKFISKQLKQAVVATEDKRFYHHFGLDPIATFRAIFNNLSGRANTSGASTITQQLARNSADMFERTLDRKAKELALAIRIELAFSKDEILTFYLNRIFLGRNVYGVGAAADAYFGKRPADLNLQECALLAGIISAPNAFSPWRSPEKARESRARALSRMSEQGFIKPAEAKVANAEPLILRPLMDLPASHAVEAVAEELRRIVGQDALFRGGLKVHTTIDLNLQRTAEAELERWLSEVERMPGYKHPTRASWDPDAQHNADILKTPYLQGSFVAIDNADGGIVALVGGRSFEESPFNRATRARRQAGSSLKPFIYAAAFRDLGMAAFTEIDKTPFDLKRAQAGRIPASASPSYITARQAIEGSDNFAAMRTGLAEGLEPFAQLVGTATRGSVPPYPSSFLGACEFTPLQLASAFTVFPCLGAAPEPFLVQTIHNTDGKEIYRHKPLRRPVLSPQVAFQIHDILRGVVDRGTARQLRTNFKLRGELAGKTGTTDDYRDAWFVGYCPGITSAAWVGLDKPQTVIAGGYASRLAVPLWGRIMRHALVGPATATAVPVPKGLHRQQGTSARKLFLFFEKREATGPDEWVRDGQRPLARLDRKTGYFADRTPSGPRRSLWDSVKGWFSKKR